MNRIRGDAYLFPGLAVLFGQFLEDDDDLVVKIGKFAVDRLEDVRET